MNFGILKKLLIIIIVRFVKVNDYLTSSDRLVIFDVRTSNILYNELNSFSTFAEVYAAYNVTNNFIINMKEVNNDTEFKICEEDNKFVFTLSPDAKVLYINSVDDLINLPKLENKYTDWTILDFEKIAEEYDTIEVNIDSSLYYALYTWDCDSILIMNPNIIRDTNF